MLFPSCWQMQIDIHPNATMGEGIMLDHGTGECENVYHGSLNGLHQSVAFLNGCFCFSLSLGIVMGETAMVREKRGQLLKKGNARRPAFSSPCRLYSLDSIGRQQLQYTAPCNIGREWQERSGSTSQSERRGIVGCRCDRARQCCYRGRLSSGCWNVGDFRLAASFSGSRCAGQDYW